MMRPLIPMRAALADPNLFGPFVTPKPNQPQGTWDPWKTLLIAIAGESLTDAERKIFSKLTHRAEEPREPVREFWGVVGRRGGKSRAMAILACWVAALCDFRDVTVPGERAVVICIAMNQKQALAIFGYIAAIFDQVPMLSKLVTSRTFDSLTLSNGITIEVRPANFRGLRGVTCVACLADEIAFWFADDNSANPDSEILAAIRPSMMTTNGMLVAISSPYARRGEMWNTYNRHFGDKGDPRILVAQGATIDLNPSANKDYIAAQIENNPEVNSSEYLAVFRSDLEAFISRERIQDVTVQGRNALPYNPDNDYVAFVDAASGSGRDSMVVAIAHAERRDNDVTIAVLDCIFEIRPPFSPSAAVDDICGVLKQYRVTSVIGDRWAAGFVKEAFEQQGIHYEYTEKVKSDLYREFMPYLTSQCVELLDHPRMTSQFVALERRVGRSSGKDSIDHPPNGNDDVANAVAGVMVLASTAFSRAWVWERLAGS